MRALTLFLLFLYPITATTYSFALGWDFSVTSSVESPSIDKRKNIISTFLSYYSSVFSYRSLAILIDDKLVEPRGRIYGSRISLSSHVLKDGEFLKLFIHEFGHYIDLYFLTSAAGRDASETFYGISWKDTTVKLPGEGLSSFVSGYAATNKYEDFAESFTFYIFHNTYFADRALKNESVRQKYLFLSNYIFPGGQFMGKDYSSTRIPSYIWDTTKVPISLQKYLYSMN